VEVPHGGWLHQPLAKGKGVRREAESEGSRRQTLDPRTTNPRRGRFARASLPNKAKPDAAKGRGGKLGGYMGGKSALLPGEACRERRGPDKQG
jgi:hypothetical protein